tara:strand:- start:684 stop:914 length:231 start_codon:yes stop_codon:yes gene_type:complete
MKSLKSLITLTTILSFTYAGLIAYDSLDPQGFKRNIIRPIYGQTSKRITVPKTHIEELRKKLEKEYQQIHNPKTYA